MRFLIMHGSIVGRDAIGSDILGMCDVLSKSHECWLFGEYVEVDGPRSLSYAEAVDLLSDPDNAAIYHHSIHWERGEEMLSAARARVIFKYHNVTPPSFFGAADAAWEACVRGREQTFRLAHRFRNALWLTDSMHNLKELGIDSLPNRAIVPPFLSLMVARGTVPNPALLRQLIDSTSPHVLMVGRFVANKGHSLFVRVLAEYKQKYGEDLVGIVVGKSDPEFRIYFDSVLAEAERLGVSANLKYVGGVSDADLLAYYLGCDVYLCCSDHEGFCVPVVEAQAAHLPVVAKSIGAVRETLGPGQILLGDQPCEYASVIRRLCRDESYWKSIIHPGAANYRQRFTHDHIAAAFGGAVEAYLGIAV
jgi:glycosyltransferase involved in cell wall biosynthesis